MIIETSSNQTFRVTDIATMTKAHDKRHDVRIGKRVVGFVSLFTIGGESAWRFIANRKDIAELLPTVAPKHTTAEAALAYVNRTLGINAGG